MKEKIQKCAKKIRIRVKTMQNIRVMIKKKLWGGKIEIAPDKIEYIWE